MKPSELYGRPVQTTSRFVYHLHGYGYNHMPEVGDMPDYADDDYCVATAMERVEIRWHKSHMYDFKRSWDLASVWLDGKPFMVIQNAGRDGDDHSAKFVTDADAYRDAVRYIQSLRREPKIEVDVVDADSDIPDLACFYYGQDLDGEFYSADD